MEPIHEHRMSSRVVHEATIIIETRDSGYFHYATMYNFSGDGMFCGSDCALKAGTIITIRMNGMPFKNAPKTYLGKIRRCEELEGDDNSHLYGLGIKILNAIY